MARNQPSPPPATQLLPEATPTNAGTETRTHLLHRKHQRRLDRQEVATDSRDKSLSPEARSKLMNDVRLICDEEALIESELNTRFIPQHGPRQLISPRVILRTPLFRVASRSAPRKPEIALTLADDEADGGPVRYVGPELRQTEGLVFMSLLHMLRDLPAGTAATFQPKALYVSLFGHYDGRSRPRLASAVRRLLRGQIITKHYTVQLCHRFDHPARGPWTVAIDPDIVRLFASSKVWLDIETRVQLPEGLATWLYGYIESQSRLIPTRVTELHRLCGTEASVPAFLNSLRQALTHLNAHHVIDPGYELSNRSVRWRKWSGQQGGKPLETAAIESQPIKALNTGGSAHAGGVH